MNTAIDQILDKTDLALTSVDLSEDVYTFDECIDGQPPGYYSISFINQVISRRRKPTLKQAKNILETIERGIIHYNDNEWGEDDDYEDDGEFNNSENELDALLEANKNIEI